MNMSSNPFQIAERTLLAKQGKFDYVGLFTSSSTVRVKKNDYWLLVDKEGKSICEAKFESFEPFVEGKAVVREKGKSSYFIDEEGNTSAKDYSSVHQYSERLAMVSKNGQCGYIDHDSNLTIPLSFQVGLHFSESVAWVMKEINREELWFLINKEGGQALEESFTDATSYSNGLAIVSKTRGFSPAYFVINKQGKPLTEKYNAITRFSNGVATAVKDSAWFLLNTQGKAIREFSYSYLSQASDGIICARSADKCFYLDLTGDIISALYEQIGKFSEGLGRVKPQGKDKMFFIDKTGKQAFDYCFDSVSDFSEGVAEVLLNGKYFYIDHTGQKVF